MDGEFNFQQAAQVWTACGISGSSLTLTKCRNTIDCQGNEFFGEKRN